MDAIEYDPITHLNALFGHPSTLHQAAAVSQQLHTQQNDLDHHMRRMVARQAESDADSVRHITQAKEELGHVFGRIDRVRARALDTERAITDMTADIKRLDQTKRNLTLSMTALKRLQMLTTAYEQLRLLASTRQYRDCAHLVSAVVQLMAHFKTYRSINQIA
ncbi:hypothetical protein KCU64_g22307, partial [Aureobasidium melanogenum]